MNTVAISPLTCEPESDARYHLICGGGVKAIHAAMTKVKKFIFTSREEGSKSIYVI